MGVPYRRNVRTPPTHWRGEDGRIHEITFQGKLLTWKVKQPKSEAPPVKTRGAVVEFSRQSRLRLLKLLARIDWPRYDEVLFVTLTYPDPCRPTRKGQITQARSEFWRSIEKHLGRHQPGIWRIEWEIRKSGQLEGEVMCHLHNLIPCCRFIPADVVNAAWKAALRWNDYCRTETKHPENERQCVEYVAKYAAKAPSDSLVNAAYLNRPTGRHWGCYRQELLPMGEEIKFREACTDAASDARDMAVSCLPGGEWSGYESFSVFGDAVPILLEKFRKIGLTTDGKVS